jgi:hypothetical protein
MCHQGLKKWWPHQFCSFVALAAPFFTFIFLPNKTKHNSTNEQSQRSAATSNTAATATNKPNDQQHQQRATSTIGNMRCWQRQENGTTATVSVAMRKEPQHQYQQQRQQ